MSRDRLIGRQVWCHGCINKKPSKIIKADFLIPFREGHYDLAPDELNIDSRVMGICKECLTLKNDFQRKNKEPVNVSHKHLVYTGA